MVELAPLIVTALVVLLGIGIAINARKPYNRYRMIDDLMSVLLGELDPLSRFLERLGLTGDDGVLSDWEFTVSIGRETMTPDRYQATAIREGDELLVRGELDETPDGFALRGTEETPLLFATGRLEERGKRSQANALGRGVFGFGLILVGVAVSVR